MALSGSFYQNVGSRHRVYCTWTGTQSITGNYTDITLDVYWQNTDNYGAINSSATKTGSSTIDGTTTSFTFTAGLRNGQGKHVHTQTKRVYHNTDGTKTITMSASLGIAVTLSGVYYGTVTASDTVTLDPIPRASTLSSSASWTAGDALAISIARSSSNFTHTVVVKVAGTEVKRLTGVGASTTIYWNEAELTQIFTLMNTQAKPTRIEVTTYNGSTNMGTTAQTGTISVPRASFIKPIPNFNLGDTVTLNIDRKHGGFRHNIGVYYNNDVYLTSLTNVSLTGYWEPTVDELSTIYNANKDSNQTIIRFRCRTYYNGVLVRSDYVDTVATAYIVGEKPTFSSSSVRYADTNVVTRELTGDDQYIIGGLSELTVYIDAPAQAHNGASIVKYVVMVDGREIVHNVTPDSNGVRAYYFQKVSYNEYQQITVRAVDSRGQEARVIKDVKMVPYFSPIANLSAARQNKFEETTVGTVNGRFAPIVVENVAKNSLQSVRYRHKPTSTTTWSSWNTVSFTTDNGAFLTSDFFMTLDNTMSHHIEVQVADKIRTTTSLVVVGAGQPIMFIDTEKNSVGINKFPKNNNGLEVQGNIETTNTVKALSFADANGMELIRSIGSATQLTADGDIWLGGSANKITLDSPLYTTFGTKPLLSGDGVLTAKSVSSDQDVSVGGALTGSHKFDNGFNWLSIRDGRVADSPDMYLIQNLDTVVQMSGKQSYKDITFPEAFVGNPLWVIAMPKNSNSTAFHASVFSITSTGCRVYLNHIHDLSTTVGCEVQIIACGIKR